jgi:hypothetical protein
MPGIMKRAWGELTDYSANRKYVEANFSRLDLSDRMSLSGWRLAEICGIVTGGFELTDNHVTTGIAVGMTAVGAHLRYTHEIAQRASELRVEDAAQAQPIIPAPEA